MAYRDICSSLIKYTGRWDRFLFSSVTLVTIGNAGAGALGATTYPSEDGDMLGAEAAYTGLEAELKNYLDTYESTHD